MKKIWIALLVIIILFFIINNSAESYLEPICVKRGNPCSSSNQCCSRRCSSGNCL